MAKRSLGDLVDKQTTDLTEARSTELTDSRALSQSNRKSVQRPSKQPAPPTRRSGVPELPKYARLVRKEARLSEDQVDQLTRLSRAINRERQPGEGERITENTLIRIAVELLLSRSGQLAGSTEEELAASLNLHQ